MLGGLARFWGRNRTEGERENLAKFTYTRVPSDRRGSLRHCCWRKTSSWRRGSGGELACEALWCVMMRLLMLLRLVLVVLRRRPRGEDLAAISGLGRVVARLVLDPLGRHGQRQGRNGGAWRHGRRVSGSLLLLLRVFMRLLHAVLRRRHLQLCVLGCGRSVVVTTASRTWWILMLVLLCQLRKEGRRGLTRS